MMLGDDKGGGIGGRRYSRIFEASQELTKGTEEFLFDELMVDFPQTDWLPSCQPTPKSRDISSCRLLTFHFSFLTIILMAVFP